MPADRHGGRDLAEDGHDHGEYARRRDHPSAQRGVIDCAEWVGGVEDLRLGFHNVWKYHYTPGMHENVTIGEVLVNMDVWKSLKPEHQELMKSVASETFVIWWAKWQRQNADALKELQEKHGVRVLRTPGDILVEFLKTWDTVAAEESQKNPFFKKRSSRSASTPRSSFRRSASCSRRTSSWRTTTSRRPAANPRRKRTRSCAVVKKGDLESPFFWHSSGEFDSMAVPSPGLIRTVR